MKMYGRMKEFVLGFYHFVSGSGLEQHLFKPLPLRPPSVRVGSISPGCTTGPQHTVEHYYQKFGVGLVYSVVSTYEKHFKVKQRLDKPGVFFSLRTTSIPVSIQCVT